MEVFGEQNRGRGGAILTPNKLFFTFVGSYVCANFGENRSRNTTVRVLADGETHTLTDANRFYNLSHAICYSYWTDKILFIGAEIRLPDGKGLINKECLQSTSKRLKVVSQLRILNGIQFQVVAA